METQRERERERKREREREKEREKKKERWVQPTQMHYHKKKLKKRTCRRMDEGK